MTAALQRLLSADDERGHVRHARLPAGLAQRYGSDLIIPLVDGRPTVIANFVSTIDGVVAFDPAAGLGGGTVSGHFEPDRFVMGLLRATADAVLIGAGTARSDARGRWITASVHPPSAEEAAELRASLGLAINPTTVVVTASGELDAHHPGLSDPGIPAVVATTWRGRSHMQSIGALAPHVEVIVAGDDRVEPQRLIDALHDRGLELVLCEGGPHLIADLFAVHLIDELFLTTAPQIAGRGEDGIRLGLVEGRMFAVGEAPWAQLVDVRTSGGYLFARYRFTGVGNE